MNADLFPLKLDHTIIQHLNHIHIFLLNLQGGRTTNEIVEYMQKQNDPDWKPPPSAVVTLTAENFTKFVKEEKLTLVEWYAPWCKHCKQLEPG